MVVNDTPIRYGSYGELPALGTVAVWGVVGLAAWWLVHRMMYTHHVL